MEIRFSYGNKTDAELLLMLHANTFIWLQRKDRLKRLSYAKQPLTPSALIRFMECEDREYRLWLSMYLSAEQIAAVEALL